MFKLYPPAMPELLISERQPSLLLWKGKAGVLGHRYLDADRQDVIQCAWVWPLEKALDDGWHGGLSTRH